jgi:hypothetical protein
MDVDTSENLETGLGGGLDGGERVQMARKKTKQKKKNTPTRVRVKNKNKTKKLSQFFGKIYI